MFYFIRTPGWLKKLYRSCTWSVPGKEKLIYLSFDDGPHPVITPFVLDELKKYNAKATFFCIGKNVVAYPDVYKRIIAEGHAVGNHTYDHWNAWKTKDREWLANVLEAKKYIDSNLFRPPYGRVTRFQLKMLSGRGYDFHTIMWTVLSGDFDISLKPEKCCANVINNTKSGDIIVFHDSEKANSRMRYTLPLVLKHFSEKGYHFEKIEQ